MLARDLHRAVPAPHRALGLTDRRLRLERGLALPRESGAGSCPPACLDLGWLAQVECSGRLGGGTRFDKLGRGAPGYVCECGSSPEAEKEAGSFGGSCRQKTGRELPGAMRGEVRGDLLSFPLSPGQGPQLRGLRL